MLFFNSRFTCMQEEFQLALFKSRKRENIFANRVKSEFLMLVKNKSS